MRDSRTDARLKTLASSGVLYNSLEENRQYSFTSKQKKKTVQ